MFASLLVGITQLLGKTVGKWSVPYHLFHLMNGKNRGKVLYVVRCFALSFCKFTGCRGIGGQKFL
ncbi:hypothetical protein GCM10008025_24000 [Ornithinibacillus halotolerans]|uniref:Uncharacterized protein n=1 Tax=Ornithinibacillus halotolerans TaxID=1274357 RepID=A0A916S1V2_9BACI|nr:hypothetical protein GCM10008025_24000 [Ornithinibacillus halotolerans]